MKYREYKSQVNLLLNNAKNTHIKVLTEFWEKYTKKINPNLNKIKEYFEIMKDLLKRTENKIASVLKKRIKFVTKLDELKYILSGFIQRLQGMIRSTYNA